ncbi:hypothetical protein AHAS_Ahas15G0291600 [Arachis hypogaea]
MVPEEESMNMDNIDEESPDLKDRWYKDTDKDDLEDRPFDPCPTIPVSKEEFEDWCKRWQNALIIKVLGKRVGLVFLEQCLQRDLVKKVDMGIQWTGVVKQWWNPLSAGDRSAPGINKEPIRKVEILVTKQASGISGSDDSVVDHVKYEEGSGSHYNILYEEEPGGTNMYDMQEDIDR